MDVRRCELSCYGAARSVYGNLLKQSGNVGGLTRDGECNEADEVVTFSNTVLSHRQSKTMKATKSEA